MAIHGKATGIILGGYDITPMLNDIGTPQTLDATDVTPFQAPGNAKKYIPGQTDATVSMGGMFEGDMDATELLLDTASEEADSIIVSYGRALALGQDVKFGAVHRTSFEVSSPVGDFVSISGAAQATGGLRTGRVLARLVDVETTTTVAQVDGGAATTKGGRAVLAVTDNDRNGAITVKVQHSSNGSVWVDKATFGVVAPGDVTGEVVDLTGTINRYLRAVVTLAGSTGSATVTVALARG